MLAADVNVLVNAQRADAPHHTVCRRWLDEARAGQEPLAIASLVLSGLVRVTTHPRVFALPTPLDEALHFAEVLVGSPAVVVLEPGPRHWSVFVELCRSADARGNHIPDAYLAAMAMEQGATWVTLDRGFARYRGLRVTQL